MLVCFLLYDLQHSQAVVVKSLCLLEAICKGNNLTPCLVHTGMGIYDAMKLCRADVSTVCFGLAASMGAFLLAAGSKGKRYCMPNARVMIHQPLGGAGGSVCLSLPLPFL